MKNWTWKQWAALFTAGLAAGAALLEAIKMIAAGDVP